MRDNGDEDERRAGRMGTITPSRPMKVSPAVSSHTRSSMVLRTRERARSCSVV